MRGMQHREEKIFDIPNNEIISEISHYSAVGLSLILSLALFLSVLTPAVTAQTTSSHNIQKEP